MFADGNKRNRMLLRQGLPEYRLLRCNKLPADCLRNT